MKNTERRRAFPMLILILFFFSGYSSVSFVTKIASQPDETSEERLPVQIENPVAVQQS